MGSISFARGIPAPELLPVEELADCARAAVERDGHTVLNYGPVGGYGPLREWIAERHGVEPGRVLVTNGSLEGLNLVLGHFVTRGRVLVEAPTYDRPLKIAQRLGIDVVAIPQDDEGLDVDRLEAELERDPSPAFLYVLPTFQNPSGRTLPLERRRRLVELVHEHQLTVLEDDPYRLVRFEGEPVSTLHELEGGERVLYSSSFSKIVAPGLRVGYFVLPAGLAAQLDADSSRGRARRGTLEPSRGRLLRLARLAGRRGCRRASDAGGTGGREFRQGRRLLPGRVGRTGIGQTRLQLRLARGDRGGRGQARHPARDAARPCLSARRRRPA